MPAGAGNPPNIKMEPPKSNFNIREGGGRLILGGRDYSRNWVLQHAVAAVDDTNP